MAKKAMSRTMGGGEREAGTAVQEMPQSKRWAGWSGGPTHAQIALRAQEIWKRHGCPPGEDKENWFEAEAELRREMGIR